jgi:hypothetical protein
MSYASNWLRAVALKQAYPQLSETGAEGELPAPPTFGVAEFSGELKAQRWKAGGLGAFAGFVAGMIGASLIWQWEANSPRAH